MYVIIQQKNNMLYIYDLCSETLNIVCCGITDHTRMAWHTAFKKKEVLSIAFTIYVYGG